MNESVRLILIIAAVLSPIGLCMPGGVVTVILFWIFAGWYFGYVINPRMRYRKALKDMLDAGLITEEDLKEI